MAEPTFDDLPEDRAARYAELRKGIAAIISGEPNRIARCASAAAVLKHAFQDRFFWCGFYLCDPNAPDQLVIGPYQGSLGCLRIRIGQGVCGAAAAQRRIIIVPNVHEFSGHIACDARSNSEIVVPLFSANGDLAGVLDIDSTELDAFDQRDAVGLEAICADLLTHP